MKRVAEAIDDTGEDDELWRVAMKRPRANDDDEEEDDDEEDEDDNENMNDVTVELMLEAPHVGDAVLRAHKERLLLEAEDVPEHVIKEGHVHCGPFVVIAAQQMYEMFPMLPEECLCGGVPLSLLYAVSVVMLEEVAEPEQTVDVLMHVKGILSERLVELKEHEAGDHAVLAVAASQVDDEAIVLARYREGQRELMLESIDAVERLAADDEELSECHQQVHCIQNVLSIRQCEQVVQQAEAHAAVTGWTSDRHVAYPTTDLAVKSVPALAWLPAIIEKKLLPELATQFGLEREALGIEDMFIAKYEAGGQAALDEHEDGSPWSFVLALNANFDGGGTQFVELEDKPIFHAQLGGAVMFCGRNRHCGCPTVQGTRYILAGFLCYDNQK